MKSTAFCLTQKFGLHLRCARCDLPLEKVTWKDQLLVLSLNQKKRFGHKFLCIKCILSPKIGKARQFTPAQLDIFLRKIKNDFE